MEEKIIGIMGLIALRKSELFYKVLEELSKDNQISEEDKEKIKRYIAERSNEKLLSKEEIENKKINNGLKLDEINIDIQKIISEIKL